MRTNVFAFTFGEISEQSLVVLTVLQVLIHYRIEDRESITHLGLSMDHCLHHGVIVKGDDEMSGKGIQMYLPLDFE